MLIKGKSDIGKVRAANEDGFDFGTFEDGTSWAIVCDGMGSDSGNKLLLSGLRQKLSKFADAVKGSVGR